MKMHNLVKLKAFLGIHYILEGNPCTCTKRHIYAYSSFICNRLKLESTPKSIKSRWKNKIWYIMQWNCIQEGKQPLYTSWITLTKKILSETSNTQKENKAILFMVAWNNKSRDTIMIKVRIVIDSWRINAATIKEEYMEGGGFWNASNILLHYLVRILWGSLKNIC